MIEAEEEEKPVDFIPELNIFGQPVQRLTHQKNITEKPKSKPEFHLETAIPRDRLIAGVIDILILFIILHFIDDDWLFQNHIVKFKWVVNINTLVGCLYHGFFDSSEWQGTPGKRLMGIKISNISGKRISFIRSVCRYLASGISIAVLFLGYINIFSDKHRQAWHDMMADTYVIRDKEIDAIAYSKKRKNGYIIALILLVVNVMIYVNLYSQEMDIRNKNLEAKQGRP